MRNDGLFAGPHSIRVRRERLTALSLLVTIPVTLAVIGWLFHGLTPTQFASLFVIGMVLVSLARGQLLGSSIRARREEFPQVVEIVERTARRLGVAPPVIFIRNDYFVPVNAIGLGEPYALVISSQYLQLLEEEELAFLVGRELGHIAAGNTRLSSLVNASGRSNPFVTSLFGGWLRQTEYSADRAGLLCSTLEAAVKAIAVSTFHVSGRQVEAAMLADQRRDIESDVTLRLGELTGMMPYAVNRVRALETFALSDLYQYWVARLADDPLPVRAALGPADGPVDRRELASFVRRWLALGIDLVILSVIFQAVLVTVAPDRVNDAPGFHIKMFDWAAIKETLRENVIFWYFPYAALLVAFTGRTIGMMVLDLRVVRLDHGRAGILQVVARYVLALASMLLVLPVLIGFWRRLQPHDRFSQSRLIGGRAGLG